MSLPNGTFFWFSIGKTREMNGSAYSAYGFYSPNYTDQSPAGDAGRASAPNILLSSRGRRGSTAALLLSCESQSRLRVVLAIGAAGDRFGAFANEPRALRCCLLPLIPPGKKGFHTRLVVIGMARRALMTQLIP